MTAPTIAQTRPVESTQRKQWNDSERFLSLAMLLPAGIYVLLLVGVPFVLAILLAFSDATVGDPALDNFTLDTFQRVLADPTFQRVLSNNFFFTIVSQAL